MKNKTNIMNNGYECIYTKYDTTVFCVAVPPTAAAPFGSMKNPALSCKHIKQHNP